MFSNHSIGSPTLLLIQMNCLASDLSAVLNGKKGGGRIPLFLLTLSLVGLWLPSPVRATTDTNAAALWLFDETSYMCAPLLDGTQNGFDLRLTPTGQLSPGKYGNALRLAPGTNYNAYYSQWDGMVEFSYMFTFWGDIITRGAPSTCDRQKSKFLSVPLSEQSIAHGSKVLSVPDFTSGKWKTNAPYFALES
jgi:hypothetical protein